MLYNSNGLINTTTVSGSSYTGLYAPDGSWNVVLNNGTQYTGRYHPCGAFNAFEIITPTTNTNAPNGNIYVVHSGSNYFVFNPAGVFPTVTLPTNLISHSEAFDQWSPSGVSVNPNVSLDPVNGNLVADRFIEVTGTAQHILTAPSVSFTSGLTYTFSVYVKYETAEFIQLVLSSTAFGLNAWGNFDIQNGVLGTMGTASSGQIVNTGNGWFRCSISAPATASASAVIVISGANSASMTRAASYAGDSTNTWLLADAQVETGSVANRYVSTP